jgi:two-component system, LytTR family, response regulator
MSMSIMRPELRILIVDDERPARDKLRRLLATQAEVVYVAEARDGLDALAKLAQEKFDAVFLDVQMPEMDGISMAQQLPVPAPLLVFVTAFDQFAVRAFDANAIDYLLKPYDEERFLKALTKLRKALLQSNLSSGLPASTQAVAPLVIRERNTVVVLPVHEVHWVEAADNYVLLHTATGSHMLRQTMATTAQRLGPAFARCHRSYLVQLAQIARLENSGRGDTDLCLHSGARVACSRQYRDEIMLALAQS